MPTTHIIGCGGVASYFLPSFIRALKHCKPLRWRNSTVILHDGDKLEERNLERQNFEDRAVGRYKATSLMVDNAGTYPAIEPSCKYIDTSFEPGDRDLCIVFADNHLARSHVLAACDRTGASCISAANSTIGAEAWWYEPAWKGTRLDPRVRHPEIDTDDTGSPVHAAGCQSEERLNDVPQTPIANFMAASHAMLLWNFHILTRPGLDADFTRPMWPVVFSSTGSSNNTINIQTLEEENSCNQ